MDDDDRWFEINIEHRVDGQWVASLYSLTDTCTQAELLNTAFASTPALALSAIARTLDNH